jgi:uncharacterized membrane protein YeiH
MAFTYAKNCAMLQLIEFLGIITFALSGIVEARRKRMDLVGVYTVALITAFGGGTLRDLFRAMPSSSS